MKKPSTPQRRLAAFIMERITEIAFIIVFVSAFENKYEDPILVLMALGSLGAINLALMTRATTLGKLIFDMKIVNRKTGKNLGFVDMLFRETVGKIISGAFFMLGFIWIMIDNDNRGWHDMIFNSQVVDLKHEIQTSKDEHDDEFYVQG